MLHKFSQGTREKTFSFTSSIPFIHYFQRYYFTLSSTIEHLEYPLAEQVAHALKQPIRKGLERLEARWYMSIYQDETSHDTTLLKLAKLDFNLVQSLHKEELSNIARFAFKSLADIPSHLLILP